MSDIIFAGLRAGALLVVFLYLWRVRRARYQLPCAGWGLLLAGVGLLAIDGLLDMSANVPSLNRFVVVGDTQVQNIVTELTGFVGACLLIAVGLVRWIPNVAAARQNQARLTCTQRQYDAIVGLVTNESVLKKCFPAAARVITETAAEAIEVERASVWLLSDDRTKLRCVDLFQRTSAEHSEDAILAARDYPRYFDALATSRAVAAHDVRTDPRISEFTKHYLVPRGITSMLDAPIRVSGEIVGVVCYEHVGPARQWTDDEVSFAAQLADQAAQALVSEERDSAEHLLRIQRDVAVAVSAAGSVREAFDQVLEHALRIDGIDCGGGYVVEEHTGSAELVSHRGLPSWFVEQTSRYEADSPNARMVLAGDPVYGRADEIFPATDEIPKRERLRALAVVPVKYRGQVVAALNFTSHTLDKIGIHARDTLESVAAQIGGVVVRARSDEATRQGEQRYRKLAELLPEVVCETDRQGNLTFVNRNAFDVFGYSQEDFDRGLNIFQVIAPADVERAKENVARTMRGQKRDDIQYTLLKKDGTEFPATIFVDPIICKGEPVGLRGIVVDVTRQKQAESALQESENKYRQLVEQSLGGLVIAQGLPPRLVFVNQGMANILTRNITHRKQAEEALQREVDFRNRIVERAAEGMCVCHNMPDYPYMAFTVWNPRMTEITGYTMDQINRLGWYQTMYPDPEIQKKAARRMAAIRESDDPVGEEWELACAGGVKRVVSISTSVVVSEGETRHVLSLMHDVTDLKTAQKRAVQAERLAAIGETVAGLAHESRNALHRSQACLEMLAPEVEDRPRALEWTSRLQDAQSHLHYLFEQVRDYAGPVVVNREPVQLSQLIDETWEHLEPARKGRTIRFDSERVPTAVKCHLDPVAIESVFRNILENSIAACRDPVEIIIDYSEVENDGRPAIRISFRDNGPGLDREQRQRILEPFYTTKTSGIGLGMAIAERIVKAHGGHIDVDRPSGRGTKMVVTLPKE